MEQYNMGKWHRRGLAFPLHHVHANPDTALRVFNCVQRDPVTINRVDTKTPVANTLHQSKPGWHRSIHVVPTGSRLHPEQPTARGLPSTPNEQLHKPRPRGTKTGRHRHHRWPSNYVGLQPLHRHFATAPLSSYCHTRHCHSICVLLMDFTSGVSVCLFQHDTLPSVSITKMPIIRVIHIIFSFRSPHTSNLT